MNRVNESSRSRVKDMTRIGMLSAIAFIFMYFSVPVTFVAPEFIKLDISDLPILIGSFAMGPIAGVIICAFKNIFIILIKGTTTGGIGELSNFIIGSGFAISAGLIYNRKKTYKTAVIALLIGTILMTSLAVISNYYFIFPLYANFMPMEAIINAGAAVTSKITDLWSMMVYSIIPFNLLKGFIVSAITILIYKKVSFLLKD
ncbi:MAG: ECF transporter S component [Peptoniphilaceae bacterium]